MLPPEVRDLERFFKHPGADALGPGVDGQACANLRHALLMMGYPVGHGERFDDELEAALVRFQTDCGHPHRDGRCGAGTRSLLVRRLFETGNGGFFNARAPEPQSRRSGGQCFISYSRNDGALVAPYVELLRSWGFNVWLDSENIVGGEDWKQALIENIARSYVAVPFLTQRSLRSRWCKFEARHVAEAGKPAIALQFDAAPLFHWSRGHYLAKRFQQLPAPPADVMSNEAASFRARLLNAILAHQQHAASSAPPPPAIA